MKKNDIEFDFSKYKIDDSQDSVTPEDIINDAKDQIKIFGPIDHDSVLDTLLDKLDKIDFYSLAELEEGDKLKTNHYLVIAIEHILSLALANDWGLCRRHEFIYVYNGAYWSLLSKDDLRDFLGAAAEKLGIDKYKARYHVFKEQLHRQFISSAKLNESKQDENKVLINLQNGTFEIKKGRTKLRPFDRKDFINYQLPFEYNPKAKAPIFRKYLNQVQPDITRQHVLAEYIGYVFVRHLKIEKALLLYGGGANGKSVFFEIINALLGAENVSSYSLKSLTDDKGYHRANIANKLVNYGSEINGNLETAIFKQLVSGEPVEARQPYGQAMIINQYARLIFNCNDLPKDVEHTNAYFRRFLIIPFDLTIPEKDQDKELANKIIKSELAGVFNWVLEGLKRLLKDKNFTYSKAIDDEVKKYKINSDSVQLFLNEENYISSSEYFTKIKDLYRDYRIYCLDGGYKPVNKSNFKKRIEVKGIITEKRNVGNVAWVEKK